jgi:hypothetical protein
VIFQLIVNLAISSVSILALRQVFIFISAENLSKQKEEGPVIQEGEEADPSKFILILLKHFACVCSNCA